MPKLITRFVALLLVPCLLADPVTAAIPAALSDFHQLAYTPSVQPFLQQAIPAGLIHWFIRSESPNATHEILHAEAAASHQQYGLRIIASGGKKKSFGLRAFMLALVVVASMLGSSHVTTLEAQSATLSGQREDRSGRQKPLPFPDSFPQEITEGVQFKIDLLNAAMRKFLSENYRVGKDTKLQVLSPNRAALSDKLLAFHNDWINALYRDMQLRGELSLSDQAELALWSTDPAHKPLLTVWIWDEFIPRYFARHGLYFEFKNFIVKDATIPILDVRPITHHERQHIKLDTLSSPVLFDVYDLGNRLVYAPHDYAPSLVELMNAATSRAGASQVFRYAPQIAREMNSWSNLYKRLVKQHPNVAKGSLLTSSDEPDPLQRAAFNAFLKGLQLTLGSDFSKVPLTEAEKIMTAQFSNLLLRHEAVHVHDSETDQALSFALTHPDRTTFLEVRADAGSAVGSKAMFFNLFLIIDASRTKLVQSDSHHGSDYEYIRNRLGYWLYQDVSLLDDDPAFAGARRSDDQFLKFPVELQNALLNRLPYLSPEQFSGLYRKVWDELGSANNPFLRGFEIGGVPASTPIALVPPSTVAKNTSKPGFSKTTVIALLIGGLAAVGLGWVFARRNRMPRKSDGKKGKLRSILLPAMIGTGLSWMVLAAGQHTGRSFLAIDGLPGGLKLHVVWMLVLAAVGFAVHRRDDQVAVKPARPEDLSAILEIRRKYFHGEVIGGGIPGLFLSTDEFLDIFHGRKPGFILVARPDHEITGYIGVWPVTNQTNIAKIAERSVIPSMRERGVGRMLTEAAIMEAKRRLNSDYLISRDWSRGGITGKLLRSLGFEQNPERPHEYWKKLSEGGKNKPILRNVILALAGSGFTLGALWTSNLGITGMGLDGNVGSWPLQLAAMLTMALMGVLYTDRNSRAPNQLVRTAA
jgi:ribosomal protein S18 acetylase RimI-like enzyme